MSAQEYSPPTPSILALQLCARAPPCSRLQSLFSESRPQTRGPLTRDRAREMVSDSRFWVRGRVQVASGPWGPGLRKAGREAGRAAGWPRPPRSGGAGNECGIRKRDLNASPEPDWPGPISESL